MKIAQIYEGWKNNLFPAASAKPLIEALAKERLAICEACPYISSKHKTIRPDVHCTKCGCTLAAKVRCLSCDCPDSKWLAVLDSLEKEHELKTAMYGK